MPFLAPPHDHRWVYLPTLHAYGIAEVNESLYPGQAKVCVLPDYMSEQFICEMFPTVDALGDKEDVIFLALMIDSKDVVFGEPTQLEVQIKTQQFEGDGGIMRTRLDPLHRHTKIYIEGLLVFGQPDESIGEKLHRLPPRVYPVKRIEDHPPELTEGDNS